MESRVIIVNESDEVIGTLETHAAHDGEGVRHRAFMILLHNPRGEVLLCRRSHLKRLWAGHWENSCSSHPLPGETCLQAGARRLREELGISAELEVVGCFEYHAVDGDAGAEHEVCFVLVGSYDGEPTPDPTEVAEWRWHALDQLLVSAGRDHWAPWLQPGLSLLAAHLRSREELPE